MTVAAKIAWAIIVVSLLGWIGALFLPDSPWTTIFRHACEGAFVGGICDAFAIWKVYGKIEVHFDRLTAEVAETVVDDLVKPEEIVNELVAKLHEPEFAEHLLDQVEQVVPDQAAVRVFLDDVWRSSLRERLIEWLVEFDPRPAIETVGLQQAMSQSVHNDEIVRAAAMRCVRHAIQDDALARRLYDAVLDRYGDIVVFEIPAIPVVKPRPTPVLLEAVVRFTVDPAELRGRMNTALDRLTDDSDSGSKLRAVTRDYVLAAVDGWVATPLGARTLTAEHLVDQLSPALLDEAARTIWAHRDRLQELVNEDLPLNTHPLVVFLDKEIGGLLSRQLTDLDTRSATMLTTKLRTMGPSNFRVMLERRTRPELDWIQVNGAGLGFVLGLTAGVVSALVH